MSALLLSENLPLRTSKALGDYAEDVPLPEVLGDLTAAPFPGIRLSDTRFFAADHQMEVTRADIDKQQSSGWAQVLESNDAGRSWTVVEFAAPVPPGSVVSLYGRGRRDDVTGELITNPADVVRRVCQIAGRTDDWSALRAECSALNLTVAGRIADVRAVKLQLDQILQSVAAIWCPGMARLYPSAAAPSPILDLDKSEVGDIQVSASATDVADVLRLSYDRSDASGRALHYIELSASPQRYGGLVKEVRYDWLRSPANAETVGRAVLQRLNGERYDDAFVSTRRSIRPGQWVRPVAHPDWPLPGDDPIIMALGVEIEPDSDSVRVTGEHIVGQSLITVTGFSVALPDTIEAGIAASFKDGICTLTFTDLARKPIIHARVSFDDQTKTTDAQGKVAFAAAPGVHQIYFEAPGYISFPAEITL